MRKYTILSITIIALAVAAGCVLSSSTMLLTYHFEGSSSDIPAYMLIVPVDLPSAINSYDKHKDKIESIDAVSIVGQIVNHASDSASSEIWLSDNSYLSPHDVINGNSTRIFISSKIPPHDTLNISYPQGLGYFSPAGLDSLKSEIVHGGVFNLYVIPENAANVDYNLDVVITMTAGI